MLIDANDPSFRSPEDIRNVLELPVLAHVPKVRLKSRLAGRRNPGGQRVASAVWSAIRPHSREAEVIRGLRSETLLWNRGDRVQGDFR